MRSAGAREYTLVSIATLDDLIAALGRKSGTNAAQHFNFLFRSETTRANQQLHSLWRVQGSPAESAIPATGTGAIPTNGAGTANSRFKFTNPSGGAKTYLGRIGITRMIGGSLAEFTLYDRLWHNSGLSATSLSAQTVNSLPLTRPDSNGVGTRIWAEVYSVSGWTGTNFQPTISYTNSDGVSGRTATVVPNQVAQVPVAGQMFATRLQSGDTGVRSIQSTTLNASQAGGDWGLVIGRPITEWWGNPNYLQNVDFIEVGGSEILDNAALALRVMLADGTSGIVHGNMILIQG